MLQEACDFISADGLGAASSCVRPSAAFRRRRRARAVAVRYAQRQALMILRMIEKPQLLAPPGLSLLGTDYGTNVSGADNVTGPLAMMTTSTLCIGSDLGIGTNIIIDETVPQDSTTNRSHTSISEKSTHVSGGVDKTSQVVQDDKITASLPIGYLDGGKHRGFPVYHEAGFLEQNDWARLRSVSRSYCDIVAHMIGEKHHDHFGNRNNFSTAVNVKRSPSKTSRPRWGSGSQSTSTKRAPRRRPVSRQSQRRSEGLRASLGSDAPSSARLLHYDEWCDGCFECIEVPIAMECSYCEREDRLIGICEHCRAIVCHNCIEATGAAVEVAG